MIGFSEKSACSSFKKASIFAAILVSSSALTTAEADSKWSNLPRDYLLSIDSNHISDFECLMAVKDAQFNEKIQPSNLGTPRFDLPYISSTLCSHDPNPCECYYMENRNIKLNM
jgi:hypothetical protein